jgi:hypothetical protein
MRSEHHQNLGGSAHVQTLEQAPRHLRSRFRGRGSARLGACLACVSAASALLAGCPGGLEDAERFLATGPCDDPTPIFQRTCSQSDCHDSNAPAGGLDLQSADVVSRLVGAPAVGGGILLQPGDPEGSVLYTKLTPLPPYGLRMPSGQTPLSEAEIECIRTWVEGLELVQPDRAGAGGDEASVLPGQLDPEAEARLGALATKG